MSAELLKSIGKVVSDSNALLYIYLDVSILSFWPCLAPM